MEHTPGTPLPWRWAYGNIWTGENVLPQSDKWTDPCETGATRIAKMDRDDPNTYGAERDRNGEYLTHAANCYPVLLAALRSAITFFGDKGYWLDSTAVDVMNTMRDAINKAHGNRQAGKD